LRINKRDTTKMAFIMPIGLYEFKVLPFGLANVTAKFQWTMHSIFRKQNRKMCLGVLA
jgi:hypothetical protein